MELPTTLTLGLILLLQAGCGLLGSDHKEPELEPGRRDYVWEVDTLYSPPGGFVYDIWGSSPNDVWAVLGTGINNLWHFNGEEWNAWPERVGPSFYSIFGFAKDDIWIGGNNGKIYHFDGSSWSLTFSFDIEGVSLVDINSIWGETATDIYAAGIIVYSDDNPQGFLIHYDGKNWGQILITDFKVQLQRVRTLKKEVFLQGINIHSHPDTMSFFNLNDKKLSKLYTTNSNEVSLISLNLINGQIYFVIGEEVYIYENNEINKWLAISNSNFGYQIYGRNEKDVFLRMNDGLAHYNGEDIGYLFDLNSPLLSLSNNAMIFEKEVFFIVNDFDLGTNYVYHGTLTE